MRRFLPLFLFPVLILGLACPSSAGFLDDLLGQITGSGGPDEETMVDGLKEALRIGTKNAVSSVSVQDGYFRNLDIRIPVPEKLEKAESLLRNMGMGERVDEFILGMNRAAEAAAPQAVDIFTEAIRQMTINDAVGIVKGGETAGTDYFRIKTSDRLSALFRPVIQDSLARVGAVNSYKRVVGAYNAIPLVEDVGIDLEGYVTEEALGGLFFMVGEEEKKIRQDPAARVTDLLREVFGN
ncbi:MAG: DUF4197 domain-containing protein [Proteobacteria bacterium]|nr:DUF4197 domain-containing protein [Pseudomonadota bacterium]